MPKKIPSPAIIEAAGNKPKRIEEYVGRVRSQTSTVSVARMTSPAGWEEPAQTPEFDEVTLVLRGVVRVDGAGGPVEVKAGEAVLARAGETVRYSTPQGAEYVAVCVPAFSPALVHRHAAGAPAPVPEARPPTIEIVGWVRSPVTDKVDEGWGGVEATIELEPAHRGATRGLEEFSHAVIVCLLHQARYEPGRHLLRRPRDQADMPEVGIFAQRAKDRPNPLGITAVEVVRVEDDRLVVRGLDAIDGTPVVDVKPYVPAYDWVEAPHVPEWIGRLMRGYF
jgi:tRNA-Thr(GGU) m(6)t(6)A37 methyltransferase TsaA